MKFNTKPPSGEGGAYVSAKCPCGLWQFSNEYFPYFVSRSPKTISTESHQGENFTALVKASYTTGVKGSLNVNTY